MKPSLVLCVLLGVVLSVRAASLPSNVEAVTATVTELYNDTTATLTTVPTTPYPTTSVTCCMTTFPSTTTTTTTPPPSPSKIMCPEGWEVFQGRCYYFVSDVMTWPQAQSNCAMLGSMLVSVHSAQEYGFLQQLTMNNNEDDNAWLGGFYLQDQWLWLDGSWFYNNSWGSRLPDSSNPCLLLINNGAWTNSICNPYEYPSICVKNSNVPPAMLCPEGWTGFLGRCYYYNPYSLSWPEADASCAGLNASLVSVHSPEEYSFLYQQTAASGFSPTWLGGFYLDNQWLWLDGSWFYQGFFTQMSPDSTNQCLSTYSTDSWNNYMCDQSFPSFCVKNAHV